MQSTRVQIGTLIVATSGVQLANGFFGTFISLRVAIENFDATLAGFVLSSYFAGFTLGALRCNRVIQRIGHIRAYAAFAGVVVAATAAMPVLIGPISWLVLRAVIGFGCAGLFVTTESWLNAKAQPAQRGRVFSTYMVGTFLAVALGQLLIGLASVESAAPFSIIVVLFAAALVLVSTTRAESPQTTVAEELAYGQLIRAAPVAVVGAGLGGLITGAFYALVPAWMQGENIERTTIALFMLVTVMGGLAFQVPVGWLSDRFDRRIVLAGLGLGFATAAIVAILLPRTLFALLPVAVLLGGLMSTLYPICVAHAHDSMPLDKVLVVSSRLILVSGIGSVLGPLIGSSLKPHFGIDGIFYLMAVAALTLALVAIYGSMATAPPPHLERPFDVLAPQVAPVAHDPVGVGASENPSLSDHASR
jgi:MFS family permease